MTDFTQRLTIVVTADLQEKANQAALLVDPEGGLETFTVPLSTDGTSVSHYWCSWQMTPDQEAALRDVLAPLGAGVSIFSTSTDSGSDVAVSEQPVDVKAQPVGSGVLQPAGGDVSSAKDDPQDQGAVAAPEDALAVLGLVRG